MTTSTAPSAPATSTISRVITAATERTIGYAELLVKDIPAKKFGHMPIANFNHPAFNIGHLSLYPNRLLGILGRTDRVKERAGWEKLFGAGCQCVEQDGKYPDKEELVSAFLERYRTVIAVANECSDDLFMQPNPMEGRMREFFPTIGLVTNFMMNNHPMMHLGQISAWRRMVGMPSAM